MAKIGKISSIKKEYSSEHQSIAGSLATVGRYRMPGAGVRMVPFKEKSGKYRTGLDPEALYIQKMEKINPEEAAQEKARVIALKAELEKATGLVLDPTSEYYTKMMDSKYGTPERAKMVKLMDGVNMFNLDDPFDHVTYRWLTVHEDIAPSYQAWLEGKVKNATNIYFYVDDVEYQTAVTFKEKSIINKATIELHNMSPERQFKVARLLALPVRQNDIPETLYNTLDSFIKSTGSKHGNKLANVNLFNKIVSMTDDNLNVRFIVEEALKYSVYRIKGMRITEGETVVAKDKEELIQKLSTTEYNGDLIALEEKIRQRKLQEV